MNTISLIRGLLDGKMYKCKGATCQEIEWKDLKPDIKYDNTLEFILEWVEENKKFVVWMDEANMICVRKRWFH